MEIIIGKITNDNKVLNKDFIPISTVNAIVKQDTSIIDPVFIFSYDGALDFNYIYVKDWNRFYFIKDITVMTGSRYSVNCHVDVLMSYKDDIKNVTAILDKVEQNGNANRYLNDGSWVASTKEFSQVYVFPDGFTNSPQYVFISAGGVGSNG